METIISSPMTKDPVANDRIRNSLIYLRNQEMTAKIEELILTSKTHFIVLGAGHYVGKRSIIDLLEQTGKYTIKR